MRGAIMTSDAMVASLAVVMMILLWAQVNSIVVGGEIKEAEIEAKKARVVALSSVLVKEGESGFGLAVDEFGPEDARGSMWKIGEKPRLEDIGGESVCVRRVVLKASEAWIAEVCA